jgi:hypothetical protein
VHQVGCITCLVYLSRCTVNKTYNLETRVVLYLQFKHVFSLTMDYSLLLLLFIYFNRNWGDTRWQQYSTHLHTNSTQNTENGTYIIKRGNKLGSAGRAPSLRFIPWNLPHNWRKIRGKNQLELVEKCPDIPVAVYYLVRNTQRVFFKI